MGTRLTTTQGLWRLRVAAMAALALQVTLGATSASAAKSTTCSVMNTDRGEAYTRLQAAVDAARPGAHLVVKGTCLGGTVIDKSLVIDGIWTRASGKPTLTGHGESRVMDVGKRVRVSLRGLVITDGRAVWGGGILNEGRLTMRDVTVRQNSAAQGGGIYNRGRLTLNGSSSVIGNTATSFGGGVTNSGSLILNDSSTISRNGAEESDGFGDLEGGGVGNGRYGVRPCGRRHGPDETCTRRGVAGGEKCERCAEHDGDQRAERGDVDGVPKRQPKLAGVIPARRQHATENICSLFGRIRDETPDRIGGHHTPAENRECDEGEPAKPT